MLLLTSCQTGRARTNKGTTVTPPPNADSPSTAKDTVETSVLTLPPGTIFKGSYTPAIADQPANFLTVYDLVNGAKLVQRAASSEVSVSPQRAPDTSVDKHKADLAERRYLLFIGIGLGIAAIAVKSLLPLWPGLWKGAAAGSVLALAAWKLSEIPAWAFGLAIGVSVLLALGYKRAEVDLDGDGIPDRLQRKRVVSDGESGP